MSIHIISREGPPTVARQSTMELLTDVATALQSVAKDYLPATFRIAVPHTPPQVVLQIPGATSAVAEAALRDLAAHCKAVTDKALPSLPLEYRVIGGSEAHGIVISPATEDKVRYPTIHVIRRRDLRDFRPSLALREKGQHL